METEVEKYKIYLENKGYAKTTSEKYGKHIIKMLRELRTLRKVERLQDIRKEDIKIYIMLLNRKVRERDKKPLKVGTKISRIKPIKNFFKYLLKTKKILYNPAEEVELPKEGEKKIKEILKEKEMRKILRSIEGRTAIELRDRAILEIMYATGIRNSELRGIRIRDIDIEAEEIKIREGKGYYGKRERIVPTGRLSIEYVKEYLERGRKFLEGKEKNEYAFISKYGNKLSIDTPTDILKKYAEKAGIEKRVYAHMIRHSCATHMLRGGADIRYVQRLLGHSNINSTTIYTKVEIGDLKKVHRKSHPRGDIR